MEEQGELKDKIFREMKGKKPSSGVRQCGMAQCSLELTFAVDTWDIGLTGRGHSAFVGSARISPCCCEKL